MIRNHKRQVTATTDGQHPFAAVLCCIDSRVPAEIVFDVGIGEMFSARVAGNVVDETVLGSLEYAAVVSGVKVLVVMGHKHCGAVNASLKLLADHAHTATATGCPNLPFIVDAINTNVTEEECQRFKQMDHDQKDVFADVVSERNVLRVVEEIKKRSQPIVVAVEQGKLLIVGAVYDVDDGTVRVLT